MDEHGPLSSVRVLEIADEWTAFTGLLCVSFGADVTVVEPPAGSSTRRRAPFVDDEPAPDRSLWWQYYNRGKAGLHLDFDDELDCRQFTEMLGRFDIVIAQEPSRLPAAIGWEAMSARYPALIWVGLSAFGRASTRRDEAVTDLTLLSGAGPVWGCGYDDIEVPPVRGGEDHAAQVAGFHAVTGAVIALLARHRSGRGQYVDVSLHAAANVTTEQATTEWLVRRETVHRQTGRHAFPRRTPPAQVQARDGRYVHIGVYRGDAASCGELLAWLDEVGIRDELADTESLERGARREIALDDPDAKLRLISAMRAAATLLATRLDGYDFFVQAQAHGLTGAVINAPEDLLDDPQLRSRGMFVDVDDPVVGRTVTYPAVPIAFRGRRRALGPAPRAAVATADDPA